jgi:gliding motility-associated-like protein
MYCLLVPKKSVKYCLFSFLVLLLSAVCTAQLCTGSLGDPVVNINFGSGPNPGNSLSSASTNYSYTISTCPNDGSYTVINSTAGCFNNTWYALTKDHTPGDVNGYMMLVNASYQPGVFYLDTVKNLCGGTTYEFSAWVLNILKSAACFGNGIQPNLSFSIETTAGTVIQNYSTGNIANLSSPQWQQYGFYFTLPVNVSDLVLRMINNAPGGCGNDLALDDITFRPCGPKVNAAFANVNGATDTAHFCIADNKSVTIGGSVQAGYNNPAFQWQESDDNGITWKDIIGSSTNSYTQSFSVAGIFKYRMAAAETGNINVTRCRILSNELTIIIDAIPVTKITSSSPACVGSQVIFDAQNGSQYAWTGPNTFSSALQSPRIASATLNDAGKYYVLVKTIGGCSQTDSTTVTVHSLPIADAGIGVAICENTSTTLQATGGQSYLWTPATGLTNAGTANPVASPMVTTTFTVEVTNQFNCSAKDTVTVIVLKKPIANAGPDKRMVAGETVQLDGTAGGDAGSYFWTPTQFINNPSILKPDVNPTTDFVYTLHVISGNGCGAASDDVFIRVFKKIAIPNAFSPNGDGINDVWDIQALESYPESQTKVFNRYGQLVFQSTGYNKPWDGRYNAKPVPFGTYYYIIDRKNDFPLLSGWVVIVK